jgi:hypothetical protein
VGGFVGGLLFGGVVFGGGVGAVGGGLGGGGGGAGRRGGGSVEAGGSSRGRARGWMGGCFVFGHGGGKGRTSCLSGLIGMGGEKGGKIMNPRITYIYRVIQGLRGGGKRWTLSHSRRARTGRSWKESEGVERRSSVTLAEPEREGVEKRTPELQKKGIRGPISYTYLETSIIKRFPTRPSLRSTA